MNSPNGNIRTASGVAQDKKVRVRPSGREACSKSKLHFPPQADHNWKSVNAFATRLGRQMGATENICINLVPNIEIFAWETGTSLHSIENNRNWFWKQSSIILILMEFPLPSIVALIQLS